MYKRWGNDVFSFVIPSPEWRPAEICIEHLYADDEIKTEFKCEDGIVRRLYMGNDFNDEGLNRKSQRICVNHKNCGPNSIKIIDGSSGVRVRSTSETDEDNINYAMSKELFAENILNNVPGFDHMNFDNFMPVFRIIKEIVKGKE